jgi:hypothetical protein
MSNLLGTIGRQRNAGPHVLMPRDANRERRVASISEVVRANDVDRRDEPIGP